MLGRGSAAGRAAVGLGTAPDLQQDWARAEQHLTAAMALNHRIGVVPGLARTQLAYAELLFRRDNPGDCLCAAGLLGEASATAVRLGMADLEPAVKQVKALVSAPQENRKRPSRWWSQHIDFDPKEAGIMPWSIPAAQAAGFAAGMAAGEVAGEIAKELGASERVERFARQTAHMLASTGVRLIIHVGMADPVGAATAPFIAAGGAHAHQLAHDHLAIDRAPVPNPSR